MQTWKRNYFPEKEEYCRLFTSNNCRLFTKSSFKSYFPKMSRIPYATQWRTYSLCKTAVTERWCGNGSDAVIVMTKYQYDISWYDPKRDFLHLYNRFVCLENCYNATDAMQCGLVFTLWSLISLIIADFLFQYIAHGQIRYGQASWPIKIKAC